MHCVVVWQQIYGSVHAAPGLNYATAYFARSRSASTVRPNRLAVQRHIRRRCVVVWRDRFLISFSSVDAHAPLQREFLSDRPIVSSRLCANPFDHFSLRNRLLRATLHDLKNSCCPFEEEEEHPLTPKPPVASDALDPTRASFCLIEKPSVPWRVTCRAATWHLCYALSEPSCQASPSDDQRERRACFRFLRYDNKRTPVRDGFIRQS